MKNIPGSLEKFLQVRDFDEKEAAEIKAEYEKTGYVEVNGSAWGDKPTAKAPKAKAPIEPKKAPVEPVKASEPESDPKAEASKEAITGDK